MDRSVPDFIARWVWSALMVSATTPLLNGATCKMKITANQSECLQVAHIYLTDRIVPRWQMTL
jgi:hypothetical protein